MVKKKIFKTVPLLSRGIWYCNITKRVSIKSESTAGQRLHIKSFIILQISYSSENYKWREGLPLQSILFCEIYLHISRSLVEAESIFLLSLLPLHASFLRNSFRWEGKKKCPLRCQWQDNKNKGGEWILSAPSLVCQLACLPPQFHITFSREWKRNASGKGWIKLQRWRSRRVTSEEDKGRSISVYEKRMVWAGWCF